MKLNSMPKVECISDMMTASFSKEHPEDLKSLTSMLPSR